MIVKEVCLNCDYIKNGFGKLWIEGNRLYLICVLREDESYQFLSVNGEVEIPENCPKYMEHIVLGQKFTEKKDFTI